MKCIKCGCPDNLDDAVFCKNCGFELNGNYCTNDQCYERNNGEPAPCDPEDCYCDCCGSPTVNFEAGIISPKTYNQE